MGWPWCSFVPAHRAPYGQIVRWGARKARRQAESQLHRTPPTCPRPSPKSGGPSELIAYSASTCRWLVEPARAEVCDAFSLFCYRRLDAQGFPSPRPTQIPAAAVEAAPTDPDFIAPRESPGHRRAGTVQQSWRKRVINFMKAPQRRPLQGEVLG
jgi:hypothetical protein